MKQKLSDDLVRRTKAADGRLDIWDIFLPGFGVRIAPGGRRTWQIIRRGSRRKIGVFDPEGQAGLNTKQARALARELLADDGPAEPRTFAEVVEAFLAHGRTRKGRELRQVTLDQYRRNFRTYASKFDHRAFRDIARRDVAQRLSEIAVTSGPATAALVRAMLARLWAYGVEVGEVSHSVVAGTPGYEVPKRTRVLNDNELRRIWAATEYPIDYHVIIRLLLLTGCRRAEIGGLRQSELVDGELRLPGTRTKNHAPLVLPLPHQALAELDRWRAVVAETTRVQTLHRDLLFGQNADRGFVDWADAKQRLDDQLAEQGPMVDWNVHDIRRTIETRLAMLGVQKEVGSRLLNHAINAVTATYDRHDYQHEKAAALQLWADELDRIVQTPLAPVLTATRTTTG